MFWVTIGSNTNLHLTLIYIFSVLIGFHVIPGCGRKRGHYYGSQSARTSLTLPLHFATMAMAAMADLEAMTPPLPPAFLEFLRKNDLDPSIYAAAHDLPRYVRFEQWRKSSLKSGLLMVHNFVVFCCWWCTICFVLLLVVHNSYFWDYEDEMSFLLDFCWISDVVTRL